MLTAYIFCAVVGGGLLALSLFGDFLDGDVDADGAFELEGDFDTSLDGADFTKLFSLRAIVYTLFGFGAAGAVLHAIWSGGRPGLTAVIAGGMGIASGALISTVFGYLKRTESGTMEGEESLVGLGGEVRMAITEGGMGEVRIESGSRQFRMRARADDPEGAGMTLEAGRPVVVVDVKEGVALVAPLEMKLLED
ncbi:MAG: hypothetical protein OXF01_05500 [Gemmatimonadetes bacterium]|nr:hypothetical protein [Gemmatimonadota bacterium]